VLLLTANPCVLFARTVKGTHCYVQLLYYCTVAVPRGGLLSGSTCRLFRLPTIVKHIIITISSANTIDKNVTPLKCQSVAGTVL